MKNILFILLFVSGLGFSQESYLPIIDEQIRFSKGVTITVPSVSEGTKSITRSTCTNLESDLSWNVVDEFTPTSSADMTNAANAGKVALISQTFATSGTWAANMTIVPRGGLLSGTGVNRNGALIVANNQRAFSTAFRFTTPYDQCMSPEMFGSSLTTSDGAAITAMVENSMKGYNFSTNYSQNTVVSFSRSGDFFWLGNDSKIDWNLGSTPTAWRYLYATPNLSLTITDLEIDGNDIGGNLFNIGENNLYLDNFYAHNLYMPQGAAHYIISMKIPSSSSVVVDSKIYNSKFHKMFCEGDGAFGNGDGRQAGFLINKVDVTAAHTGAIEIDNTEFYSFWGQASDPIYVWGNGSSTYTDNVLVTVNGSRFKDNTRRDIKAQHSGLQLTNNSFEKIPTSRLDSLNTSVGAALTGSGRAYQNTQSVGFAAGDVQPQNEGVEYSRNFILQNNTFTAPFDRPVAGFVGISNAKGMRASGNNMSFHSNSSAYAYSISQAIDDVLIENDTLLNTNLVLFFGNPDFGTVTFKNMEITQNVTNNQAQQALMIHSGSGDFGNVTLENSNITMDFQVSNLNHYGMLGTQSTVGVPKNIIMKDLDVVWTGGSKSNIEFIKMSGSFDSSNRLENILVTGAVTGTKIQVDGTEGYININTRDENGTPLTVQ